MEQRIGDTLHGYRQQFLDYLELHVRYSPHTRVAYARDTQRLIDFLATEAGSVDHPSEITREHLMRFAASLRDLAPATVCRILDALSSWFNYLRDIGVVDENVVAKIPRPRRENKLPVAAAEGDCRALMAASNTPLERVILGGLMYLGVRRSELLSLDVADFSPGLNSVRVDGKGSKQRDLPVPQPLRRQITAYLRDRSSDAAPLLLNQVGRRLGSTSLQRMWTPDPETRRP